VSRRGRGVPLVAVVLALIAIAFFTLPLIGLLRRAPWSNLGDTLQEPAARDAIRLSIECSLWSTFFSLLFGVPLAYVLARARFPGRALVRALVVLPMVLPPVVGGVALLYAFQRNNGLVGGLIYDLFDFQFTFSKWGVILAETFVAMPFLVITVEAGLRSMDRRYEDAASSLGAGRWTVFRRITVPMIGPALIAGAALAWARALGEFGATITFAGNIQGRTQTTPLAVYLLLEAQPEVAIALSLLLLAISIVILVSLRDHWFGGLRGREAA
jgi:molybdate transport system permease protein